MGLQREKGGTGESPSSLRSLSASGRSRRRFGVASLERALVHEGLFRAKRREDHLSADQRQPVVLGVGVVEESL